MFEDTIAAIATPLGEGGLAVIRLSGPQALVVADKSFVPAGRHSLKPSAAPTHTVHYGNIMRHGRAVDEVLLLVMRAPRTFTREDVAEIDCHGGILAAKLVLDTVLENGARLAEPGEFSKRAFLNGRLDLAQAEAVADLIHARTELSLAAANEQLAGKLSQRINQLRDDLMKTLAHVEAHIDFPDEDISPDTRGQLLARLDRGVQFMDDLLRTANEGQILRRGIRTAIIGRPNAGKSSLLNQLLGHDRAIVSPIAGTTRDTIEETANIRGLPVVFVDTAGLRQGGDSIEQEGIRRSRETVAKAELILHVFDVSEPFTREDENYLAQFAQKKRIFVRNKIDLPPKLVLPPDLSGAFAAEPGCSDIAASGRLVPSPSNGVFMEGHSKTTDGTVAKQDSTPCIHEPTHPRPLQGGEQTFVRATTVPLQGGVRAGFTGTTPAQRQEDSVPGESAAERVDQPSNLVASPQVQAVSHPLPGGPLPGAPAPGTPVVDVCALTGQGIDALKDAIKDMVWAGEVKAEMLQVMINSRHQDALRRAREATVRTVEALRNDLTLELVALDLRIALNAVGEVVGKTTTEDLLDSIFSQFCLGK